jgi:hypothetical protein
MENSTDSDVELYEVQGNGGRANGVYALRPIGRRGPPLRVVSSLTLQRGQLVRLELVAVEPEQPA